VFSSIVKLFTQTSTLVELITFAEFIRAGYSTVVCMWRGLCMSACLSVIAVSHAEIAESINLFFESRLA